MGCGAAPNNGAVPNAILPLPDPPIGKVLEPPNAAGAFMPNELTDAESDELVWDCGFGSESSASSLSLDGSFGAACLDPS